MRSNGQLFQPEPGEMVAIMKDVYLKWAAARPDLAKLVTDADGELIGNVLARKLVIKGRLHQDDVQKVIDDFQMYGRSIGVDGRLSFQHATSQSQQSQETIRQAVREVLREVVQQAQTVQQADDATPPHSGDVSLAWLRSVDDYADNSPAIREKIANFCQPAARGEMTRDASGRTLSERFSDRVTWLKNNNVRRPKVEKPTEVNPLSEEQKRLNGVNARVEALKNKINRVVVDNQYSKKTLAYRESLHKTMEQMIRDRCTIGELERTINAEIAQQESGSIR